MRGLFGAFGSRGSAGGHDEEADYDLVDEPAFSEPPPSPVGQDERRMQVRAYNHWASMLGDRNFPAIEDLDPADLPDFGPYGVLLDFSKGIENPGVPFLGDRLAVECGDGAVITQLNDVPSLSLLSRITDHYMQILANQAPIGFEAEFVNGRGLTVLYRGILLPFSSDDETIDYIYGVINWKEVADQQTTDTLLAELDQALSAMGQPAGTLAAPEEADEAVLDLGAVAVLADDEAEQASGPDAEDAENETLFAQPDFGDDEVTADAYEDGEEEAEEREQPSLVSMQLVRTERRKATATLDLQLQQAAPIVRQVANGVPIIEAFAPETISVPASEVVEFGFDEEVGNLPALHSGHPSGPAQSDTPAAMLERIAAAMIANEEATGLHDCLASARELADALGNSEDRTRGALYRAVSRAYDVSLAAAEAPEDFAELLADAGIVVQDRAPMTPVVKLVFGPDYDKTRLTEYAAVLAHGQRLGLQHGDLRGLLQATPGGLKAVVAEERRLRRAEDGKPATPVHAMREELAKRLRAVEPVVLDDLPGEGAEFALVMVRRLPSGELAVLGEVPDEPALVQKAARRLLG